MADLTTRLMAGLLACSGALTAAACQASAVPSPYTQSAQPSVSPTAAVVPLGTPNAPASVAPTRTTSPTASRPATTGRPTPSSSLGPLRLSYRGITKLVVVKSDYNNTPAGRAAIDAIARYNGALATATQDRTIEPAKRLAAPSCTQCQSDMSRIDGYIRDGQEVVQKNGSPLRWIAVAIFVRSVSHEGEVIVEFDGQEPGLGLVGRSGSIIEEDPPTLVSDLETVRVRDGRATIIDTQPR